MKNYFTTLALCILSFSISYGQNENSIYFDNIDDYIIAPGAGNLVSGTDSLSISIWVYPQNTAPSFPDYDGFGGFRNNGDFDFYILQLSSTNIEARFRNSLGTAYDVVFTGLQLNTWQHFVLTYDGTTLTLYHNGVSVGSVPASGTASNGADPFYMGMLPWPGDDFYTNGKLDEVSLWNKTLTPVEISCIYNGAINPAEADLKLYYRFNQGSAGGNNISITSLIDASGHINGVLNNFTLNGPISNFVPGVTTSNSSTSSAVLCPGTTITFGSQTITTPGVYYEVFPGSGLCDSVAELVVTTETINIAVGQSGPVLTAQQTGATYQWIDCINANTPIPNATGQTYTATANGQYAAIITMPSGCADTTVCATVTNVGLNDVNDQLISLYPNPVNDLLIITVPADLVNSTFMLTDISGRVVNRSIISSEHTQISVGDLPDGVYFLEVRGEKDRLRQMIVKN